MIAESVRILRDELASYIVNNKRDSDTLAIQDVVLDNIANLESDNGSDLSNKIVLSLVNVQEEGTLKNLPNYKRNPTTGGFDYDRPPAYINLFLLISMSPDESSTDTYELSMDRLSLVIEFFQAKNFFDMNNSPHNSIAQSLSMPPPAGIQGTPRALIIGAIKMYVDLYSLTFEQLNHLWGSLGGKQVPSVLYKIRLVQIQHKSERPAPIIEEVSADSSSNTVN